MKYLLIVILFLIFSCKNSIDKTVEKDLFYFASNYKHHNKDTMSINEIPRHTKNDSLIQILEFKYKNKEHVIRMFTNEFNAPIDGGIIKYELDNLGVIYGRSTTWKSFNLIESNNDSINKLISFALGKILLEPQLRDYTLIFKERTIDFSAPNVK